MSEEEIIEYLTKCLDDKFNYYNATRVKDKQAIQGLLDLYKKLINENNMYKDLTRQAQEDVKIWKDLYNKEKEKNKELIEGQVETIERIIQPELLKKYIHKDKIKAKTEKYNKIRTETPNSIIYTRMVNYIDCLQELLEDSETNE